MASNRVTLSQLLDIPASDVAALPVDFLALLQDDIEEAKRAAERLKEGLALRYGSKAQAIRKADGRDTGAATVSDGDYDCATNLPKKVTWDQKKLAALYRDIQAGGKDPSEYISVKYDVSETKYKAWPEEIRSEFTPARTDGVGSATFKLEKAKD